MRRRISGEFNNDLSMPAIRIYNRGPPEDAFSVSRVAFIFGLLAFHCSVRYSKAGRLISKIPGPKVYPIFGNTLSLWKSQVDLWKFARAVFPQYPILKLWSFTYATVIIHDPDDVKILLLDRTNIRKASMYNLMDSWLGTGLISSTGELWHRRRKLLTPSMNANNLRKYIEITNQEGAEMVNYIRNMQTKVIPDLKKLVERFILRMICGAAMDFEIENSNIKPEDYDHGIEEYLDFGVFRSVRPYLSDWMIKFMEIGRRQQIALHNLLSFTNKVISDRRVYLDRHGWELVATDSEEGAQSIRDQKKNLSFLDILLFAERENLIDDKGVRDEVNTFMVAGYDTTSVTLLFCLLSLAENEKSQDLARAEVSRILDNNGGKMAIEDIQKFDYIDRCVKESLRLLPTVPLVGRTIEEDIQLKNHWIPAGTDVMVSIWELHRNPNLWSDPEKFEPDRFLPQHVQNRHPFSFLPFSAGLRNCIGQKLGMLQVKALVARILYNFYLEPVDRTTEIEFKSSFVLQSTHPLRVKFIQR
ncbi:hypothetical protein QAD02_015136 [Eretmocerus hayati]|uniref:Uncharacterized protein n=1 Tax=Eretmocerus hayati TaxID=131215 RepID=A0ACC2P7T6_9HYME|nr:hypothetical protein QAD02_015136 [Eretmocerus hayati]